MSTKISNIYKLVLQSLILIGETRETDQYETLRRRTYGLQEQIFINILTVCY